MKQTPCPIVYLFLLIIQNVVINNNTGPLEAMDVFVNLFYYACSRSGLLNFCAVALALSDLGYRAVGIRIDSGDLAYLSNKARECFVKVATKYVVLNCYFWLSCTSLKLNIFQLIL